MSFSLGLDLGGSKLAAVAVDAAGQVVAEVRVPTPATAGLVESMLAVVAELESVVGPAPLGVGMPALVSPDGTVRVAPHLPGFTGLRLGPVLSGRLGGRRVVVENDATAAAAAEIALGAARGSRNVVLVTLGTGIGGGLVVDGNVVRGAHGFAGELGHMVVDPAGPPCACGRRGCWEARASGSALAEQGREAAGAGRADGLARLAGGAEWVRGEHVTA
ncbi:MAG: ROK family protein, partial [Acidimicrobiales bacterium]